MNQITLVSPQQAPKIHSTPAGDAKTSLAIKGGKTSYKFVTVPTETYRVYVTVYGINKAPSKSSAVTVKVNK